MTYLKYFSSSGSGAQKSSAIRIFPFISPQQLWRGAAAEPGGPISATALPRRVMMNRFPALASRSMRENSFFAAYAPTSVALVRTLGANLFEDLRTVVLVLMRPV